MNNNFDKPIATGIDSRSGKYIVILKNYWSGNERVRVREILDNGSYGPVHVIKGKYIKDYFELRDINPGLDAMEEQDYI